MKYLASAAMALALAAFAASASADQPNNDQNGQQSGHHGGDAGGNHNGGQGGHSQGAATTQGAATAAATTKGAASGQVHTFNGGVHTFNGGVHTQGVGQQGYNHGYGRGPGVVSNGQAVTNQVQGVQTFNHGQNFNQGQGGQSFNQGQGGQSGWRGDRRDRGNGFVAGIAIGPGGQHNLRGRDEGREWFHNGEFPRQSFAERRFHDGDYNYPRGWYARSWSFGQYLPFGWFAPDYYLDFDEYGLPQPPIGCEWVREGPDAVLVNIWTGEILSVWRGVFW